MPATDKLVTKTVHLTVGGTDLSPYCRNVQVNMGFGDVDISALADPSNRHAKGTGDHSVTFEIIHAKALSNTLSVLAPMLAQEDPVAVVYRAKDATKGADNHEFRFDALINQLPFGGSRGEANMSNITVPIDGQVTIDDGTTTTLL